MLFGDVYFLSEIPLCVGRYGQDIGAHGLVRQIYFSTI